MSDAFQLSQPVIETIAGFIAGAASTLVAHPLDVLKTRLQVDRVSSSHFGISVRHARNIFTNEGIARGFYRGLSPNLIGNSVSWALYFLWYHRVKTTLQTRMLSTASDRPGAYRSITHGIQQIYRAEGPKGYYRGLVPSLFGVSHGALQFMVYEQLKLYRTAGIDGEVRQLVAVDYLSLSGASKVLAGSITYPYQVVRARLQMYEAGQTYTSARDAVAQIWKHEGLGGFYKGLGPNLVRVLPSTWVTFLVYEKMKTIL
ncbi:MAG: hypothetical protein Q9220_004923 [cf. Caloplaca sp. 1 TL-2023]